MNYRAMAIAYNAAHQRLGAHEALDNGGIGGNGGSPESAAQYAVKALNNKLRSWDTIEVIITKEQ